MCEFISWIEKEGTVLFLNPNDVYDTKRGKELQDYCKDNRDLIGHGAIKWFYSITTDVAERECIDFSSPNNFPPEIADAIKKGLMAGFDVPFPKGLLAGAAEGSRDEARAAYDEARAAYNEARDAYNEARAAYDEARAAYNEARAAYDKARDAYDKARAAYNKAVAAYNKASDACDKASAAYNKASDACDKAVAKPFWNLFSDTKNRSKAWK